MASTIDYLLQDSEAVLLAVNSNKEALTAKGFTEAAHNGLTAAREALKTAELTQQKAVNLAIDKTAEQNEITGSITELIRKVRNAAKSAYVDDARMLKLFKIGEKIPDTVKKLCTTCNYMASIAEEKKGDLLQGGLVQEDIVALNSANDRLVEADAAQEAAKKLQEAATLTRDAAAKVLKEKLKKLRNFVLAAFANKPELLVQFEPISKGRGKGGPGDDEEETPPPDAPTPPAK